MTIAERVAAWKSRLSGVLSSANEKITEKGGTAASDLAGIAEAVDSIPQEIDMSQLEENGVSPDYVPTDYSFIGYNKKIETGQAPIFRNEIIKITSNKSRTYIDNGFYFYSAIDVDVPQNTTNIDTSSLDAEADHVMSGKKFIGRGGEAKEGSMSDAVFGSVKLETSDIASNYVVSVPITSGGYVGANPNGMTVGTISKYTGVTTITPTASKQTITVGGKFCPDNIVVEASSGGAEVVGTVTLYYADTTLTIPYDSSFGGNGVLLAEQTDVSSPTNSGRFLVRRILIDLNSATNCLVLGRLYSGDSNYSAYGNFGTLNTTNKTITLSGYADNKTLEFRGTYTVYQI